jgi:hypothetical protein
MTGGEHVIGDPASRQTTLAAGVITKIGPSASEMWPISAR